MIGVASCPHCGATRAVSAPAAALAVGARVRVVDIPPGYPQSWVGLLGNVTELLGEAPTYRVVLEGVEMTRKRGEVFVRSELVPVVGARV